MRGTAAPMISHGGVETARPKKTLSHLRVMKGANGGHIVEHHFTSGMHEPEQHPFSDGQGKAMLAHVAKHMGVAEPEAAEEEENAEGEE